MILYKSLLLIVFLNSFVTTEKNMKRCFYSRYMYYVFKLHEIIFKTKIVYPKGESSNLNEINRIGESLRAQGQTVLLILDDLMTKENQLPSLLEDMMTTNLYLNNVSNTLLVQTYNVKQDYLSSPLNRIYKDEFKIAVDIILQLLYKSVQKYCPEISKDHRPIIRRNSSDIKWGNDELNKLLPKTFDLFENCSGQHKEVSQHMIAYYDSILELKYLMKPILYRQTYMRYHPKHMLFYDVLFRGEKNIDLVDLQEESKPDYLEMLRNVTLETKLVDDTYPDIDILFSMVQRVFDVKYVKSFQQQVLAATAHPVLSVIGSYLGLVENMFYTGDKKFKDVATRVELFEKKINDLGDSILNTFVSFIRLGLYPKTVLEYLKLTAMELDDIVKYNNKKNIQWDEPEWLGQILRRCTTPMMLNKLRFVENEFFSDEFINVNSEESCNNSINALTLKVDKVGKYVNELKKYKNIYHEIINENSFFSHENMFDDQPAFDVIEINKYGYSVQGGSRHKDKTSDGPNLLDL